MEDEEEKLNSIKLLMNYADDDGKSSTKLMTIKVNKPKLKNKVDYFNGDHIYLLSFSLKIPDHIHSGLVGKTVPLFGISARGEMHTYPTDYGKTLTQNSIETLTTAWCNLLRDYRWVKQIENADLQKVIFYNFEAENRKYNSTWNSDGFGQQSELGYKYAIGFVSIIEGKETRYNHEKKSVNKSHDREFYLLKYVTWTQEREDFFSNMEQSFKSIGDKIMDFESKLSEETINKMITNKLLLS